MKFAPVVFLLAFALCTSCATSPPAGAPAVPAVPAAAAARARELGAECQRALEAGDYAGARATAAEALHLDPQYEEGLGRLRDGLSAVGTAGQGAGVLRTRAGVAPVKRGPGRGRMPARLITRCSCSPY